MNKENVIEKINALTAQTTHENEKAVGKLLIHAVTDLTAELVEKHLSEGVLKEAFGLIENYAQKNHGAKKCCAISSDEALKIIFDAWAIPVPENIESSETVTEEQKPVPAEQAEAMPKRKLRRISLDD